MCSEQDEKREGYHYWIALMGTGIFSGNDKAPVFSTNYMQSKSRMRKLFHQTGSYLLPHIIGRIPRGESKWIWSKSWPARADVPEAVDSRPTVTRYLN